MWLKNNTQPNLIFLDIQLSDGLSFEIFEEVQLTSAIIFTTAYDQYALKAFKLNSIDYLLKPIDEEEVVVALQKFKSLKPKTPILSTDFNVFKQLILDSDKNYKK